MPEGVDTTIMDDDMKKVDTKNISKNTVEKIITDIIKKKSLGYPRDFF